MQKLLSFFRQKYLHISDTNVLNFNETLTNDVVSFDQPGPGRRDVIYDSIKFKFQSHERLKNVDINT